MIKNKIDLITLKHNIDMLRIAFNSNESIKNLTFEPDNRYGKGIQEGYQQANKHYKKYIESLENLLEGVNIYE